MAKSHQSTFNGWFPMKFPMKFPNNVLVLPLSSGVAIPSLKNGCGSQWWPLTWQELGIGALHIKLRATGGTKTRTPGGHGHASVHLLWHWFIGILGYCICWCTKNGHLNKSMSKRRSALSILRNQVLYVIGIQTAGQAISVAHLKISAKCGIFHSESCQ